MSRKPQNKRKRDIAYHSELHTRDVNSREIFKIRYPLIVPIVYYEGTRKWTADFHLKDRIEFAEHMEKYIPDFSYEVVSVSQYTNEELSMKRLN